MEQITTINNQQFYLANIDKLLEFSSTNKCAVIIDEKNLSEFLNAESNYSENSISQLIIISDSLNNVISHFVGKDLFLIAAHNIEQAIALAFQSEELNENILFIVNNEISELKGIIESVVV